MWQYNYELYHHGIKGMKWGVRRYQNKTDLLQKLGRLNIGPMTPLYMERAEQRESPRE